MLQISDLKALCPFSSDNRNILAGTIHLPHPFFPPSCFFTMHQLITRLPFRTLSQRLLIHQTPRVLCSSPEAPTSLQSCSFSSTSILCKKDKTRKTSIHEPESGLATPSEEPYDLSQLHASITSALSRFKDDLSKLRAGGRFNTASLEELKVLLRKDSGDTARLSDLAQVVPKSGRMVAVLAAEAEVSLHAAL